MNEKRGPWFMLTGAVLGIIIGVMAGWGLAPASNVDTPPASLRIDFKDQYRYMIAAAYSADGNLVRARARLGLLGDANPISALGDQSQRMLANNTSQEVVQTLADLAQALQNLPAATAASASPQPAASNTTSAITPVPATPAPTATSDLLDSPVASDTPLHGATPTPGAVTATATSILASTATPTVLSAPARTATLRAPTFSATPNTPFVLSKQASFCDPAQPGLVQIVLQNASGQPAPGVELIMTWVGGEEHFFTGLKPELGNGYADFVMSPGVEYALSMSAGATRVAKLIAPACTGTNGTSYPGGIRLEFKQQP
jgi:hypothetical protein